ncbi:MAG: beta-ketoacyl synthase chain length factor [Saprospiraceae bacterium]|nr:beta-ketoacyl synthase chain length factor [Saprospiraceae bacterium]
MFIRAASTISHQPTFRNKGFSSKLLPLTPDTALIHPDYGMFIPPKDTRRLNDILKMAITCTSDCLLQAEIDQPDAIIVGTSMGCNEFTKTFLDKIHAANGGLIAPTAFMLSTHNTIAGQVSLFLGNQSYNITHTHNNLSFEHALVDAMMAVEEGKQRVLVGAADEMGNELYDMHERLQNNQLLATSGASLFILSDEGSSVAIHLIDVDCYSQLENLEATINDFLKRNKLTLEEVNRVLFSASRSATAETLSRIFQTEKIVDYQVFSGAYYVNSAFAMHLAVDLLEMESKPGEKVLICNNLIPNNLGLILLSR